MVLVASLASLPVKARIGSLDRSPLTGVWRTVNPVVCCHMGNGGLCRFEFKALTPKNRENVCATSEDIPSSIARLLSLWQACLSRGR
ncbi:hypothetical protein SBA4_860027 [Candidatus Sulfopaludibacter sp. SbA4]|nr:hypothetical protein SBA4_860027 [Candidatus Sulfopaludibacter sp. SbA4]